MDYSTALINGVPLVMVVIGLVEWTKRLGVSGKALIAVSMGIGLILGVLYQMSVRMPVDFSSWFSAVVYGFGLGLVASGVYDAIKSVLNK